jgi:hypothetical protein
MDFGGPQGYYSDQNMINTAGHLTMQNIQPQYYMVNNMMPVRNSLMYIPTPNSLENGKGQRVQIPEQSGMSGNGNFDTPKQ